MSPSHAWPAPQASAFGKDYSAQQKAHPGQSGFCLLDSGLDALAARATLIERAQHTVDLQYYIVRDDATGRFLLSKLKAAAKRGVRVRLLIDDFYVLGREAELARFASEPGIETRSFNPFRLRGPLSWLRPVEFVADGARLNRRMHNKVFVVDNQVAIVGGRNLGDEYFEARPELDFHDLDLLAVGPVVREISKSFDAYWNSRWALPVRKLVPAAASAAPMLNSAQTPSDSIAGTRYADLLETSALARGLQQGEVPLVWSRAEVVQDPPRKVESRQSASPSALDMPPKFIDLAEKTHREMLIISAYVVPGRAGAGYLEQLRARGVQIGVLTNSLATIDMPAVYAGYARYRAALLRAGLDLYELKPTAEPPRRRGRVGMVNGASVASLHAKAFVFDRSIVYVGSFNLDPRSVWLNTEIGLLVHGSQLSEQVARWFERATRARSSFRLACAPETNNCTRGEALVWHSEEEGAAVQYRNAPNARWSKRLSTDLWSLLPLDAHL